MRLIKTIYKILIIFIILISPFILIIRILKNKEDPIRFTEKFTFFSKKRVKGKLLWFHSVSVGEFLSIIPIIKNLEKNPEINQILITSSTLTSSILFKKFQFKKTIHQFFPIDSNFFTNRFLDYWKPSLAVFIDSEIWPIMLDTLKKKKINTILLNARISKKSFKKWKIINFFSTQLFKNFTFTYPANLETKKHLIKLGVNKIKILGNLKFCHKSYKDSKPKKNFIKFISKKKLWGAISTHQGEEKICARIQKAFLQKNKNLVLIIIPRDVSRLNYIKYELKNMGLNFYIHSSNTKIKKNTNVYIIDTYGESDKFLKFCNFVFIGKSLTKDGGQNPLDAARLNCKIFYGPNVSNFREIYDQLDKEGISTQVKDSEDLEKEIKNFMNNKTNTKKIRNKINRYGSKILKNNLSELKKYI
jgi:3-deoxy-D-manno-octulosonic-acid transferase